MPYQTQDAKSFIYNHLHEIRNPKDLAERLNYSYESLRKDFKRQEGVTLGAFITSARIEQARKLLAETDLRCAEVAYAVGFEREEVAARAFKRAIGYSMQEYRRLNQNRSETEQDQPSESTTSVNHKDQP
jgi:two-component system, response regulator YesN